MEKKPRLGIERKSGRNGSRENRMKDKREMIRQNISNGMETAYIDSNFPSNLAYRTEFISNDPKSGKKVLSSIEDELKNCEEFSISVAFITQSGITPLLQTLKELEQKGIKGKILTTDYLMFSEPTALEKLASLKNIELRMYCTNEGKGGFHTKGYIFKNEDLYKIIIGSSNMTMSAFTVNKEWNTKIVSTSEGAMVNDVISEYNDLWQAKQTEDYVSFIDNYRIKYELIKEQRRIAKNQGMVEIESYKLTPNKMQIEFVKNIRLLKEEGALKALLISATGTGKTYASAFALRSLAPQKALFLVHREQIAKQAMKSYKKVFDQNIKFGLLSGNSREIDCDYLFSTMSMMAKQEVREQFREDEFDIIVIDEAHRTGAKSYQNIMEYFKPNLWLGMTASPERTDDFDVFNAYDHNIAYEIRLQQALEENLLCPFHYYGISDLQVDGRAIDEQTGKYEFSRLTSDQRVSHIIEQAEYFGFSGAKVKGLIFCSSIKEAQELSIKFNERKYRTIDLSGEHSQEEREEAIERLVSDTREDMLDYIFTVDIFNEGVDIPEINQVIMLRPTQSPIIFVQQLGRGLRKAEDKEFVLILDFIGNYTNNFMIPIALSGDRSYNKDSLRKYIAEGNRIIPGSSTIHFDEVTKTRIYESIDTTNFNDVRIIKDSYRQLKYKLGRIPSLKDFEEHGEIDVLRIFDNASLGSYYRFLVKYEEDYDIRISEKAAKYLEFISKKFSSGKRVHELQMLKRMITLTHRFGLLKLLTQDLKNEFDIEINELTKDNVVNVMTNEFVTGSGKVTYAECVFIEQNADDYTISHGFSKELEDVQFYKMVQEIVEFGLARYEKNYSQRYQDTNFQLYAKYTYDDVCRILEWEKGEVALNIGGYKFDQKTKTYPVFINYHKEDGIQDTVKYEDRFLDNTRLIAISKSGRTIESQDVKTALNAERLGVQMSLFVRKNKDDKTSKEFYYLGKIKATGNTREFLMSNTKKNAVEIEYHLDTPIKEDIYEYLIK